MGRLKDIRDRANKYVVDFVQFIEPFNLPKIDYLLRWIGSTNHKDIGTLYIIFAAFAGVIGTLFSLFIRAELRSPGDQLFLGNYQFYNTLVTPHAFIMIFFMVMPVLIGGFGNWFVPIMVGAPDMAFPRLNNFSFWLLIPSFFLLLLSSFIEGRVGGEWAVLPPFVAVPYHSALAIELAMIGLNLSVISFYLTGVNIISTIMGRGARAIPLLDRTFSVWIIFFGTTISLRFVSFLGGAVAANILGDGEVFMGGPIWATITWVGNFIHPVIVAGGGVASHLFHPLLVGVENLVVKPLGVVLLLWVFRFFFIKGGLRLLLVVLWTVLWEVLGGLVTAFSPHFLVGEVRRYLALFAFSTTVLFNLVGVFYLIMSIGWLKTLILITLALFIRGVEFITFGLWLLGPLLLFIIISPLLDGRRVGLRGDDLVLRWISYLEAPLFKFKEWVVWFLLFLILITFLLFFFHPPLVWELGTFLLAPIEGTGGVLANTTPLANPLITTLFWVVGWSIFS